MSQEQHAIEATLASIGSKATYTGAGFGFSGALLSSEMGVFVGVCGVVGGLILTWIFKRRQDKRDEAREQREIEAHKLRMILRADHLGHGDE
jgi:membrane associated rhomboid family serine protease